MIDSSVSIALFRLVGSMSCYGGFLKELTYFFFFFVFKPDNFLKHFIPFRRWLDLSRGGVVIIVYYYWEVVTVV